MTTLKELTDVAHALACTDVPQLYDSTRLEDHTLAAVGCALCPIALGCRKLADDSYTPSGNLSSGVSGTFGGKLYVQGQRVN